MIAEEFCRNIGFCSHPFEWTSVRKNPKGDHGVFCTRQDWFKTMTYRLLDSNGFLLLHTLRGRVYWISQNVTNHTTPDWKLHFSICEEDLGNAWNIIADLFIESKCEVGMKVTTSGPKFCQSGQRGREITVYIYQYHPALKRGVMYETSPVSGCDEFIGNDTSTLTDWPYIANQVGHIREQSQVVEYESDFYLGHEIEAPYSPQFWYTFIAEAESRLKYAKIRSNGGTAAGDLPLPNCLYASLRNEAFVVEEDQQVSPPVAVTDPRYGPVTLGSDKPQLQYPSNQAGWNAAQHKNPLEETIYLLLLCPPHRTGL